MVTIITGLLLAGKTTLAKQLIEWGYKPILEYTTRPMRKGETNDKDYHFIDDTTFDEMVRAGEFAETFYVNTIYGPWKYGARKEDLKSDHVLVCGLSQIPQLLDSNVPMQIVLLDIDKDTSLNRALVRGDDMKEFHRRFDKDAQDVDKIKDHVNIILDARSSVETNARLIDANRVKMTGNGYKRCVDGQPVVTAQEMNDGELNLYLSGSNGLTPYLRMREQGMPKNPVNQIAWLLLNGGGCGFCKVCRTEPCDIKDGEKCTINIANYIRACVHKEDADASEKE